MKTRIEVARRDGYVFELQEMDDCEVVRLVLYGASMDVADRVIKTTDNFMEAVKIVFGQALVIESLYETQRTPEELGKHAVVICRLFEDVCREFKTYPEITLHIGRCELSVIPPDPISSISTFIIHRSPHTLEDIIRLLCNDEWFQVGGVNVDEKLWTIEYLPGKYNPDGKDHLFKLTSVDKEHGISVSVTMKQDNRLDIKSSTNFTNTIKKFTELGLI